MIRIGIDIGSTTAKMVVVNEADQILFTSYKRHYARTREIVTSLLRTWMESAGDGEVCIRITGSVGMGLAEKCTLPFIQEVVAATTAIEKYYPKAHSMIDIGGEDAKVVFFHQKKATDLRMNGNCAGGTGAFIDQMALILGVDIETLNELALQATQIYPIASRCGVFCKTDIQNLIAKNVSRENIAASIFHAVAVQTVITLAHGCDIQPPILFCGGPLTFIPALRKAFIDYLSVEKEEVILPENGALLPALGAALASSEGIRSYKLSALIIRLEKELNLPGIAQSHLRPIFSDNQEYTRWQKQMSGNHVEVGELRPGQQDVLMGIDSGSTTTKIVVTDTDAKLLYTYYQTNEGSTIETVERGLSKLKEECQKQGTKLNIVGSCSTGYGEDLIKAAFQLDAGIVETIAHHIGAHHFNKEVSFVLDIGGQDMKAIFVKNGVIDRIEINEACSSGCGSFIETFAKTLGYTVEEFSAAACRSTAPCDLGTRCTVFMNSKVKQALREGATIDDIAAGLSYSVVKNCLYKVLKLKDTAVLGKQIVVQGGTMRNDAIVHTLELLTGAKVIRSNIPELMGAFGCALYAGQHQGTAVSLEEIIGKAHYTSRFLHCKGCDNRCLVVRYRFDNGKEYYSGNRCEKVFTNGEGSARKGRNVYTRKNELLFQRSYSLEHPRLTIGIPRCLNMYEEYPFWHTLFTECGIEICLSDPSNFSNYEQNARMVMSDNICFPAKLVHSHIQNLLAKRVDRIFMPFVIFEKAGKEQNSYNCPIVTGYAEVVKGVQATHVPIDAPTTTFKKRKLLFKQCKEYLNGLGVTDAILVPAFRRAEQEQERYVQELVNYNEAVLQEARSKGALTILLAGRPYHTDFLIQHKISDLLADMGIYVITDDIVQGKEIDVEQDVHFLAQWAFPNRILKAAQWCTTQGKEVQFVEMTSFGCGPDAFLTDEVRDLLLRHGKVLTLLKMDDINNIGSMKLRVRSLIESLKLVKKQTPAFSLPNGENSPRFNEEDYRDRKVVVPYFTPFLSPLIPAILRIAGYDVDNLPMSNLESAEWGLKYANNEVCYPATLIVGDVIKAFKSGHYDPSKTVVAMTQTGGQCRASNYVALIRKALKDAGFKDVPVLSLSFNSIQSEQPGLKINWIKMLPVAFRAILYSDSIAKFYYASVVREKERGEAAKLKDLYLKMGEELILEGRYKELFSYLSLAAKTFNRICRNESHPKVGVVGEIYLKFNPFAQKNIIEWLIEQKIEVVPPVMADFFLQSFVNRRVNIRSHIEEKEIYEFIYDPIYRIVKKQLAKVNLLASEFKYFTPFDDIFEQAEAAEKVISLNAQFGEGWLLPAEIMTYAIQGVTNVVSLQPFGCIANHIVSKGIEKRIKQFFPEMNILSLDFDSGVSEVNQINRALLFINNLEKETEITSPIRQRVGCPTLDKEVAQFSV